MRFTSTTATQSQQNPLSVKNPVVVKQDAVPTKQQTERERKERIKKVNDRFPGSWDTDDE